MPVKMEFDVLAYRCSQAEDNDIESGSESAIEGFSAKYDEVPEKPAEVRTISPGYVSPTEHIEKEIAKYVLQSYPRGQPAQTVRAAQ